MSIFFSPFCFFPYLLRSLPFFVIIQFSSIPPIQGNTIFSDLHDHPECHDIRKSTILELEFVSSV